jgi:hypothetical protein
MELFMDEKNKLTIFTILIEGHLKKKWAEWLNGMVIKIENLTNPNITAITVRIPDQAALRGILNKLWDLNLTLISVASLDSNMIGENDEN